MKSPEHIALEFVIGIAMDQYHNNYKHCRSQYESIDDYVTEAVIMYLNTKGIKL